jgi:hypothetical protein
MATASKAASTTKVCGHRDAEGVRDCKRPRSTTIRRPSFCDRHELEAKEMRRQRRATRSSSAPKPKATSTRSGKKKVIAIGKRPRRGKVVPLKPDEAPLAAFESPDQPLTAGPEKAYQRRTPGVVESPT